jgi:hypothetical protein
MMKSVKFGFHNYGTIEKEIELGCSIIQPYPISIHTYSVRFPQLRPDGHFKLPHFWPLKLPQGGTPRLSL